jgi:hypothetical protein
MADKKFRLGMLAVALALGMTVVGCENGDTPPVPPGPIQLTVNVWADGNITASDGEQWFKFTATAEHQYIHVSFGTLTNLNVQLYESNRKDTVGEQANLYDSTRYVSVTLTIGQVYYIKVRPYGSTDKGTYQIVFNASTTAAAPMTRLTENVWADGNITTSAGEEYFKFTATAEHQYIHVSFGTLDSLDVQLYISGGAMVGAQTNLNSSTKYIERTLPKPGEYYIKVSPHYSNSRGTYQIAFNKSTTTPPVTLPSNATTLTADVWADSAITVSGGTRWFKFTATANLQFIHSGSGTLSSLSVQVYDSRGNPVTQKTLNSSTKYFSQVVTIGQVYYISVSPLSSGFSNSGTFQIAFNASTTAPATVSLPSNAIQLTANVWADGNITASEGVQWFRFTATAAAQYIHAGSGTLTALYVQLYDNGGNTVGSEARLSSSTKYASRSVTVGQEYYIKVWPSYSDDNCTYQITFNTMAIAPANVTQLTANIWADGNIPAGGEQWFKFTATAVTQYIHVSTMTSLDIQLYDNSGNTVGDEIRFWVNTAPSPVTLTLGQEYYINVSPVFSNSVTYRIAFNASTTTPPVTLPATGVTELTTVNTWVTSGGEQWFKFTATAATQYIHADFGALNSFYGLYIQLYNSDGTTAGSEIRLYSDTKYASRPVTVGQEYYIKVWPYSSTDNGTYQIGFNTSMTPPPITLPATGVTTLTVNTWADGNIPASALHGEQWSTFTATTATQYIHAGFGTLDDLSVQVYASDGNTAGSQTRLYSSTKYISRTVTVGQEYYIKVWPYSSSRGTYQIGFNTSTTPPPITLPSAGVSELNVNTWADGSITSGGEQWFRFTATAATQYIHVNLNVGALNDLYVQLYDSSGNAVGSQINLYGSTKYASRPVTVGQDYYIKVWPYYSTDRGTYKIAFNTSETAPSL